MPAALAPEAELVVQQGEWTLFRSKLALSPLSGDWSTEHKWEGSLFERLRTVMSEAAH